MPTQAPTFKLDVSTPQGALSDRRRKELVAEATTAIRDAADIPEDEGLRVWVICHEVAEGSWGAGGQVIEFEALRAAASTEREKAPAWALPLTAELRRRYRTGGQPVSGSPRGPDRTLLKPILRSTSCPWGRKAQRDRHPKAI